MLDFGKARLGTAGAVVAIVALATATVASAGVEKLKAHPKSVMVNTDTTIAGSGFPAHTTLSLRECGATFWLAPKYPCDTENAQTVETNARGRFSTLFEMQLCPEGEHAHQPTTVICYVGVLRPGEDFGKLEPAAKVKVTYP